MDNYSMKTVFVVILPFLISVHLTRGRNSLHRTINVDPTFSRWPNRTSILYYLDAYYSSAEVTLIRNGLAKFQADMQGCLAFVETPASDPRFKIHVTPFNDTGDLQTFCYTYQGQTNPLVNNGAGEQRLIITGGKYGCLDGTLRSIMKYFAIVVGKRNEHQRGDREQHIRVHQENVVIKDAYRLYNTSEANWVLRPYDFCSITHNQPTDYAADGAVAFDILVDPKAIPRLDQISLYDCQLISIIYNCPTTSCQTLDCMGARGAALPATTVSTGTNFSPATGKPSSSLTTQTSGLTTFPMTSLAPRSAASTSTPVTATSVAPFPTMKVVTQTSIPTAIPTTTTIRTTTTPPTTSTTTKATSTTTRPTTTATPTTTTTTIPMTSTITPTTSTRATTTTPTTTPIRTTTTTPTTTTSTTSTTTTPATTTTRATTTTPSTATTTTKTSTPPPPPPTTTTTRTTQTPTTTTTRTTQAPTTTTTTTPSTTFRTTTMLTTTTGAPTTSTPTTLITSPSTTPDTCLPATTNGPLTTTSPVSCSPDIFCNVAPDESSFMLGPYQIYETVLMFSGPCVMEYTMNFTSGNLVPQTSPQYIGSYLQGVGGPTVTTPVDLVTMAMDPLTWYASMSLTFINKCSSTALTCSTDGMKSTNAVTCPSLATSNPITTTATSSSPQINLSDGLVYNYIVDASQTEIALVDFTFGTTYQNSTGFLGGQSLITKVTAIQIIQDPNYVNPPSLAVFGTGVDGVTPYVGFVSMNLDANPSLPLDNLTWTIPKPMSLALTGCPVSG